MATFEHLVPPFELCQQIPKDAFNDTALVWVMYHEIFETPKPPTWVTYYRGRRVDTPFVRHRDKCDINPLPNISLIIFPAPTAQELLEAMHFSCSVVKRGYFEWDGVTRYYCTAVANTKGTEFLRCDVNLPKTLLKLWMDLKREGKEDVDAKEENQ